MTKSAFPGCCGIYVISGFPFDSHLEFQPVYGGNQGLADLDAATPQAMHLIALTTAQMGSQAEVEAAGYVAIGRSSGIHANGTAITLFAKNLSPMEEKRERKTRPRRVRPGKTKQRRK
jgi:hypothetical protein